VKGKQFAVWQQASARSIDLPLMNELTGHVNQPNLRVSFNGVENKPRRG
jgi:hypothetical protein